MRVDSLVRLIRHNAKLQTVRHNVMDRIIAIIFTVFISIMTFGQRNVVPKNITEAVAILNNECDLDTKSAVKTRNDRDLPYMFWMGYHKFFTEWTDSENKNSAIKIYLEEKGIFTPLNQQIVILVAFKHSVLGLNTPENEILAPYQKIEKRKIEEDKVRYTTDSLEGVYIPKNLDDCFRQMDIFWSDSTKNEIKSMTEGEFGGSSHFGFGLWMRNNWQLWSGSRLSKYFNDAGIQHPDDMSGIILKSYHRYLTGKEIKFNDQVKTYQDYWDKSGTMPTGK